MPWPPPVDAALDSLDDVELSSVSGSGPGTSCGSTPGYPIFGLRLTVGLGPLAQASLGHSSFVQNVSCAMSMNSPVGSFVWYWYSQVLWDFPPWGTLSVVGNLPLHAPSGARCQRC